MRRELDFEVMEPWQRVIAEEEAQLLKKELQGEVGEQHVLFGLPVSVLARRVDKDDVLFFLEDGSGRCAVVHLTWSHKREATPWPRTTLYSDLQDWAAKCMEPSHREYLI